MNIVATISRGLLRNTRFRRSGTVLAVVACLLTASSVLVDATRLTPEQRVTRDMGSAAATISWGATVPPGSAAPVATMEQVTAIDPEAWLMLRGDLAEDNGHQVWILEGPWAHEPFPERFSLREGRWPTTPGEAVLTGTPDPSDPRMLSFFSGSARVTVVGRVDDKFSERGSELLVAPGTWASLSPVSAEMYPTVSLSPVMHLGNEKHIPEAWALIEESTWARTTVDELSDSTERRSSSLLRTSTPPLQALSVARTWPDLLIPLGAAILLGVFSGRLIRRWRRSLWRLGVPGYKVAVGGSTAVAMIGVTAVLGGVMIGLVGGLAGRTWILPMVLPQPVGQLVLPWRLWTWMMLCVVGCVVYTSVIVQRSGRSVTAARFMPRIRASWSIVRLSLTVVVLIVALRAMTMPASWERFSGFGLAGVLAAIVISAQLMHHLPSFGSSITDTLARRMRRRRIQALAVMASIFSLVSALLVAAATLFASQSATDQIGYLASVPRGQVLVTSPDPFADIPRPVRQATDAAAGQQPVLVRMSGISLREGLDAVWAAATAEDLEHMVGPLDPGQRQVLETGGVLIHGDETTGKRSVWVDDLKRAPQRRETPVASVSIPAEWAQYVKGVTLTKTAAESGAFLTSPRLLYSQLTPSQEASLSATPAAHGFDPQFVSTHTPLPPATIPVSQQVVILVMALLCFGVAWAVASSAVRELRRYLASLRAVGLPDGRLRGVVVRFAAIPPLVGIACGVGLALASVCVGMLTVAPGQVVLSVPWSEIAAYTAVTSVSVLTAAAAATRSLRLSDREMGD